MICNASIASGTKPSRQRGPTQIAPVAIYPNGSALQLAKQRTQCLWCVRNRFDTFDQRQLEQSPPLTFRHAGEFIHHGFSEGICAPEKLRILLRASPLHRYGEARITGRDAVLGFRHDFSIAFTRGGITTGLPIRLR
jgi:hypothetical protein